MDKWNENYSKLISSIDNEAKWIELIFSHGGINFTVFLFGPSFGLFVVYLYISKLRFNDFLTEENLLCLCAIFNFDP